MGVIQRLRTRDATSEQPWPSLGMANCDSTLRCRPPEAAHFFWRLFNDRASSRTRIATFQTTITFSSSGEPHLALLKLSSISWAFAGGHSTIEDSKCHSSTSQLHQQRRTTLHTFGAFLHRPIHAHHCRSCDQRRPQSRKTSGPIDWSCDA